jgi:hypothetical protein
MLSEQRLCLSVVVLLVTASTAQAQSTHESFEGFRPGACGWVPRLVNHFLRRDQPDTAAFDIRRDTTARVTADSVRLCASRYGRVNPWEMLGQSRVHLILSEDAKAKEISTNYANAIRESNIEQRAWALYLTATDYLNSHPSRIAAAYDIARQLDNMGPKATRASVLVHAGLAQAARVRLDDSTAAAEASIAAAKWKTLAPEIALSLASTAASAFALKAEIALRLTGGERARAIVDSAQAMMPAAAAVARQQLSSLARVYAPVGRKAKRVEATWWFNAATTDSAPPYPGKVFIISEAVHSCGPQCRPRYQTLRRFADKFGARGLEVINSTKTVGFIRDTAAIEPPDEAKYDSVLFIAQRNIPGSLAVYSTKYRWLPDGRRVNERTPQEINYPSSSFTIVDRAGIIRYTSFGFDPVLEEPLARLIERLLTDTTAGETK